LALFFCLFAALSFAASPTLGTISPSSGTGRINVQQVFITTYSDPDGWQNIQYVFLLINPSASGTNGFYGYYNQNTNKLYLRNDANNTWLGGFAPGSNNIIENSYSKLDCSLTTTTGSGTTMTVKWAVTFKQPFTGAKKSYLYVRDDSNVYVNFTQKGTWNLPNVAPQTGAISPVSLNVVSDQEFTLTSVYSDSDGWQNLQQAFLLVNTSVNGSKCLYLYYNKDVNKLYLRDDGNTAWLGGFAPGSSNVIENSYARLNCSQASVLGSGSNLTINWPISFKSTFLGQKYTHQYIKDSAGASGAWAKKGSINVLASGKSIGPQGGEVLSSDGKIKAIIPAGALNAATVISIASVTKQAMQGAVPSGTALLSVVECKPYGLVFNKPISLIYKFDQAEIPGTQVELGLYDSVQKKIIPTGQVSTVPADGYTITCSVSHFSTYAALKSLTPQNTPIGAGVKIPLPDMFTGAFSHAITITVPAGRKGLQPALGLSYRSSNSNSWVGLGFSLNPGYIVRSTRLGPPKYDDNLDTFYFITDGGTTELVHLVDNLYQAKIESSFTKFYKEADGSWRAVGKDGSVLKFGQTSDSKETCAQGTFSWYITRAIDNNGNYVQYGYTKDQGKAYLNHIDYTGNETLGVSPTNSIDFYLESRDDKFSSYISSGKISTEKRLKEIEVKVSGSLVWRYQLEYNYSPDTSRSLLKSVTQYSSDNKNLPIHSFDYQGAR